MSESLERHKADADKLKVGQLIAGEQHRDAIHVAVAPVVAGERLRPGEHISVADGVALLEGDTIGVVDPFLRVNVKKGETFWLFLYPGSISDMYHHWLHPAFEGPQKSPTLDPDSERWIKQWMSDHDMPRDLSYATFIQAAKTGEWTSFGEDGNDYYSIQFDDEYLQTNGFDSSGAVDPELFVHLKNVLGQEAAAKPTYFSCSC